MSLISYASCSDPEIENPISALPIADKRWDFPLSLAPTTVVIDGSIGTVTKGKIALLKTCQGSSGTRSSGPMPATLKDRYQRRRTPDKYIAKAFPKRVTAYHLWGGEPV